jgi:hypothetical protein
MEVKHCSGWLALPGQRLVYNKWCKHCSCMILNFENYFLSCLCDTNRYCSTHGRKSSVCEDIANFEWGFVTRSKFITKLQSFNLDPYKHGNSVFIWPKGFVPYEAHSRHSHIHFGNKQIKRKTLFFSKFSRSEIIWKLLYCQNSIWFQLSDNNKIGLARKHHESVGENDESGIKKFGPEQCDIIIMMVSKHHLENGRFSVFTIYPTNRPFKQDHILIPCDGSCLGCRKQPSHFK